MEKVALEVFAPSKKKIGDCFFDSLRNKNFAKEGGKKIVTTRDEMRFR